MGWGWELIESNALELGECQRDASRCIHRLKPLKWSLSSRERCAKTKFGSQSVYRCRGHLLRWALDCILCACRQHNSPMSRCRPFLRGNSVGRTMSGQLCTRTPPRTHAEDKIDVRTLKCLDLLHHSWLLVHHVSVVAWSAISLTCGVPVFGYVYV